MEGGPERKDMCRAYLPLISSVSTTDVACALKAWKHYRQGVRREGTIASFL